MLNLGHNLLQLQMDTEGFNETEKTRLHNSFFRGMGRITQSACHPSVFSFALLNEAAGSQKSGIKLLVCESSKMRVVSRIHVLSWCNV
jgi:hypothetical protein